VSVRLIALTGALAGVQMASGDDVMRVLDGIDQLVRARNDSIDALGRIVRLPLRKTGETQNLDVVTARFAEDSPFTDIEVRKPREGAPNRGLMIIQVRPSDCIPTAAVVERYGKIDDVVIPKPPIRGQGKPAAVPMSYVYKRPWGKLSFGFVETPEGKCLSRAVIDWKQ
jgi:hypothetical protein